MIGSATQNVSAMGYSRETVHMALYAIIGFLDENLLSSKDPMFSGWALSPLQQQLFGDQLAGEKFFRHVSELLNMPESSEVADILELHSLCLMLGFSGKYASGDASEIDGIVRRIRDKIIRIRGPFAMVRTVDAPPAPRVEFSDHWLRNLSLAAVILAFLCLAAFIVFHVLLSQSIQSVAQAAEIQTVRSFVSSIRQIAEMS
jgi:type VI secretion system protein ImpK